MCLFLPLSCCDPLCGHAVQVGNPHSQQIEQAGLAVWRWKDGEEQAGAHARP